MSKAPLTFSSLPADVNDLQGVLAWVKAATATLNTLISPTSERGGAPAIFIVDTTADPQSVPDGVHDGDLLFVIPTLPTGGVTMSIWRRSAAQSDVAGKTMQGQWVLLTMPGVFVHKVVGMVPITVGASPFTYTAGATPEQVFVSGGVVTDISISGVSTGLMSGSFSLAAKQSIVVTYTGAPTMVSNGF